MGDEEGHRALRQALDGPDRVNAVEAAAILLDLAKAPAPPATG